MSDVDGDALRELQQRTVERYANRLREHGVSARSLGWGSIDNQRTRFAAVTACAEFRGKRVLDYGCGFADLLGHLKRTGAEPGSFVGTDINPEFVDIARQRYPESEFFVNDLAEEDATSWQSDIVVMLGLLNYKQPNLDNDQFAQRMMGLAFEWASECVICDFLSSVPTPGYEREDWVNYYSPAQVLNWALELSPRVALHHDYDPIPQREILLVIRKDI